MNKLAKQFEEKYKSKIAEFEQTLKSIQKVIPSIKGAEAIVCTSATPRIGLPLDPPSNKLAIDKLKAAGFSVGDADISEYGIGIYHTLTHPKYDGSFDLALFDFHEGATCKLKSIGTETKEVSIYEVVCNEGAEEAVA